MKSLRTLVAPLLAVTFVVGCSDSLSIGANSTPEEISEALTGTWNATSFVFTSEANSSETFDVIANGGSFTLTFTDNEFSGTFTGPGENETFSGTYVAQGTNLILTGDLEPNDPETFGFTMSGSNTLSITADDVFDFDDDGVDEPATMDIVLQKG